MSGEGIEITLRDVYDAQRETAARLADVSAGLSQLTASVTSRLDSGSRKMDDHEGRLRQLEERWWKVAGGLIVVNFLLLAAAYWLIHHH